MQKKLTIFLIAAFLVLGGISVLAQNSPQDYYSENIKNFEADITVEKSGSLSIKESILYDFGENLKHGIYRDIPLNNIEIKVVKVSDEFNNPYPFEVFREGKNIRIKIGDPAKLVKGERTYNIFYDVQGGIRFFKDQDELYWNVTGNNWEVPIENSKTIIHLPQKISENDLKFACFTGVYGSEESQCQWQGDGEGSIIFESSRNLSSKEGLTIVLGWPKGIVSAPGFFQKILRYLKNFWPFLIPFFVLIFLFREWWLKGRDFPLKKPIIAQYEPPENIKPAEAAVIMRQTIRPNDISATIVDLAVKGYLKIKEIKKSGIEGVFGQKDYEMIKLKNFEKSNKETDYEGELFEDIFGSSKTKKTSALKNNFYSDFSKLKGKIYSELTDSGHFVSNPEKTRKKFLFTGIAIFAVMTFFGFFHNYLIFNLSVSGILFIIFSFFMPKRTKKGAEAYWQILGFKEYIKTAEKYRLQFQEKENIFEKYLPYAIIFGLVDKWAKAFEGIYNQPPSWYEGYYTGVFSASVFSSSFNHALSSMNTMASGGASGSGGSGFGGGGFSGGGGGGGGGGSW